VTRAPDAGNPGRSVLVVGAGIAGIQAALDLADMGAEVHLLEETPSIGGRMPQLDKTFPTNDCSICILSPKMSECARHPRIKLHVRSSLVSVEGTAGDFTCRIREHARYVDPDRCVGCGLCAEKCPVKVSDEFDVGLRQRKAIYRYFAQSIPSCYVIDAAHCLHLTKGVCRLCEKACAANAINFQDEGRLVDLHCGAVVLANGIDPHDPVGYGEYGYKAYPNVVTSIEFERMLSASGPQKGHLVRPSDGREPRKVAFIQCVGSRDIERGHDYCSSVCCMYAIKQAVIAKEHSRELEPTIFFMDIRAFGKDFDKYYERAESQFRVKFTRARVAGVKPAGDGDLELSFTGDYGSRASEVFDLVVLSVGLEPRAGIAELADKAGVKLDKYGFCRSLPFRPLDTTRPGIFACGAANGPRDIPESVMTASGAVAGCARLLKLERQDRVSERTFPTEKDVAGERPRIGVFVCHCGINIAGVVDVEKAAKFAAGLPNVECSEDVMYACSQDCLNTIKDRIRDHDLNRVLVAACTPRTHEPLFRETLREAGLNEYLFEMANIRDQCSWAHMHEPEAATDKVMDLVEMGIAKARNLAPLRRLPIEINPRALVIGGGLAGMTAALAIADAGCEVRLLEKEPELGGNAALIYSVSGGADPADFLRRTADRVREHELVTVHTGVSLRGIDGYIGHYRTTYETADPAVTVEYEHGVVVVATGAKESRPAEYLYGENNRVITQLELERRLADFPRCKTVVMIQCVGSREGERRYCSRVCCGQAVRNAAFIKRARPGTEVYVLYRDIRTYGLAEEYYGQARELGVMFERYELDRKPEVRAVDPEDPDSRLRIKLDDLLLGKKLVIDADLVVLAAAMDAPGENEALARMLKVPLNKEGFFLEAHMKLRPVDFATDGVYMCGLAHAPKNIEESIVQAKAAAARALTVLSKKTIEVEGTVSWVNPDRCTGCGVCVEACAYAAVELKDRLMPSKVVKTVAEVNEALCKGCGACAASCRSGAINLKGFTDDQIFEAVNAIAT
jgi:heterodisulfide reductase subunit A